jgi:hypothetical protein
MQKIKYIVSGITMDQLDSVLRQLNKQEYRGRGIVLLSLPTIPEVVELEDDGSVKNISFGEFINKEYNQQKETKDLEA